MNGIDMLKLSVFDLMNEKNGSINIHASHWLVI